MKIRFTNVKWDTDGESLKDCGLQKNFVTDVEIDDLTFQSTDDEIEDKLSDWLSDTYGYCHNGFDYKVLTPKVIAKKSEIKKFFDESIKNMLNFNDWATYCLKFAKDDRIIGIMLLWEEGYEPNASEYVDENGYGINVCLVKWDSSYMQCDWKRLSDTCTMSNNYDSIIKWLKNELKHAF